MKKTKKIRAILMAIAFVFLLSAAPIKADAAKLDKTSVILLKGKTATLHLKKYPKNTKKFAWKKSGKAVKIVKKKKGTVEIKAVKCGTSVMKIKSGKKTLKCKVTVIGKNAEVKLDKGSGSTLELGAKVAEATSSNPKVVKVVKQGTSVKMTALRSGTVKIMVIVAGGKVIKLEITVPGKAAVNPAEEEKEVPETEPAVVKPETPGTEPTVTKPETPGTETEVPGAGEVSITDRREVLIGSLYHCNSDQHSYMNFLPRFLAANLSIEEANNWIDDRNEEEKVIIEQNVNGSNYSDEYKAKLLAVLHKEVIYDDNMKVDLTTEFFDIFDAHCFSYGCSSSSPSIYFYGPWETIPGDEYEEWEKLNKL